MRFFVTVLDTVVTVALRGGQKSDMRNYWRMQSSMQGHSLGVLVYLDLIGIFLFYRFYPDVATHMFLWMCGISSRLPIVDILCHRDPSSNFLYRWSGLEMDFWEPLLIMGPVWGRPQWQERLLRNVRITDWITRNGGRSFVGILKNFSRLILKVNPSRIRILCHFVFYLRRLLLAEGKTGAVLKLKASSVLLQQTLARQVPIRDMSVLGCRFRRSRDGFPHIIPSIDRIRMRKGEDDIARWWLSCFMIYRFIDSKHKKPSGSTITDPFQGSVPSNFWLDSEGNPVKSFWDKWARHSRTIYKKDEGRTPKWVLLIRQSLKLYWGGVAHDFRFDFAGLRTYLGPPVRVWHWLTDLKWISYAMASSLSGTWAKHMSWTSSFFLWFHKKKGDLILGYPYIALAKSKEWDPQHSLEIPTPRTRKVAKWVSESCPEGHSPESICYKCHSLPRIWGEVRVNHEVPLKIAEDDGFVFGGVRYPTLSHDTPTGVFQSFKWSPFPILRSSPTSVGGGGVKTTAFSFQAITIALDQHLRNIIPTVFSSIPLWDWKLDLFRDKRPMKSDSKSSLALFWWMGLLDPSLLWGQPGRFASGGRLHSWRHSVSNWSFTSLFDFPRLRKSVSYLGKIGEKKEAAGKVRLFAMTDIWTQWALRPLHDQIFQILTLLRDQDGTFDQERPVKLLLRRFHKHTVYHCYDLSAATDRLPISIQVELLRPLIGDLPARLWAEILVSRQYWWSAQKRAVTYEVGQPMGALSSWGMLALTHHLIVQWAASRAGMRDSWFKDYAVLGDDIAIADPQVAHHYLLIMKELGVGVNVSKSLVGKGIEFAKKFYLSSNGRFKRNITPISFKDYWVSSQSLQGAVEMKIKYNLSLPALLWSLGWGYKAVGRLEKPFVGKGTKRNSGRLMALVLSLAHPNNSCLTIPQFLSVDRANSQGRKSLGVSASHSILREELIRSLNAWDRLKPTAVLMQLATGDPQTFIDNKGWTFLEKYSVFPQGLSDLVIEEGSTLGDPENPVYDRSILHSIVSLVYLPSIISLLNNLTEIKFSINTIRDEVSDFSDHQIKSNISESSALKYIHRLLVLQEELSALPRVSDWQILETEERAPKPKWLSRWNRWRRLPTVSRIFSLKNEEKNSRVRPLKGSKQPPRL